MLAWGVVKQWSTWQQTGGWQGGQPIVSLTSHLSPLENNNSSWSYSYDRVAVRKFEFCSAQFFLFFLIFSRRERETDRGICYLICYLSPRDLDKIQLMREWLLRERGERWLQVTSSSQYSQPGMPGILERCQETPRLGQIRYQPRGNPGPHTVEIERLCSFVAINETPSSYFDNGVVWTFFFGSCAVRCLFKPCFWCNIIMWEQNTNTIYIREKILKNILEPKKNETKRK